MKALLSILALTLPMVAHASDAAYRTLVEITDVANVGNGDARLDRYDVKRFDMKRELRALKREVGTDTGDCAFYRISGRRNNMQVVQKDFEDAPVADLLMKLYRTHKMTAAIGMSWDGASGDSEYCQMYTGYFYTTDGYKLTLHYDYTD